MIGYGNDSDECITYLTLSEVEKEALDSYSYVLKGYRDYKEQLKL